MWPGLTKMVKRLMLPSIFQIAECVKNHVKKEIVCKA
jgi:hypothetical protein